MPDASPARSTDGPAPSVDTALSLAPALCPDTAPPPDTVSPLDTAPPAGRAMPPPDAAALAGALAATPAIDADHPAVVEFARARTTGATSDRERAVRLYRAVRDEIRYDPYRLDLTPEGMRASTTLAAGHGWCVPKAVLLAACLRAVGVPARLGFGDVRNHLSTERLRRTLGTDLFVWHGYTEVWIEGRWLKATPAFNRELCERFRLLPLEFDGTADSIYHPFDADGRRHMEYVRDRGRFDDLPLERIAADFARHYPALREALAAGGGRAPDAADWEADVARETGAAVPGLPTARSAR